jgi:tRNA A37 N6-isopentenylltransferase MiaA
MRLSIIIPAYNEGKTIHRILNKVKEVTLLQNLEKEIWQYVKRQRTWFQQNPGRTGKEIIWLNPLKKSENNKAKKLVKNFILC